MGLKQALGRLEGVTSFDMVLRTGIVTLGVREDVMLVQADLAEVVDSAGLTLLEVYPPNAEGIADVPAGETAVDPVCRMRVRITSDALKLDGADGPVYFCNDYCLTRYRQDPARYGE